MGNKALRLKRLLSGDGRLFIFPMDHGITMGMLPGINRYRKLLQDISCVGIDAVVLHKGIALDAINLPNAEALNYCLHLSASTNLYDTGRKVLVADVEEAAAIGMDAVSLHINLGNDGEGEMLKDFGLVSRECQKWGMPLMAMMYCSSAKGSDSRTAAHLVRVAEELGADMVKISSSFELKAYDEIMKYANIPVVVAGGEYTDDRRWLIRHISNILDTGISGIAAGRNIFEASDIQPLSMTLSGMIHDGLAADEAIDLYESLSSEREKDRDKLEGRVYYDAI